MWWARRPLPIVALAALTVKLIVLAQLHAHPLLQPEGSMDGGVYLRLAQRCLAGDWALGPDVYYVSPLYIYSLALALGSSGGSLLAAKVAQVLLGALAVGLVFDLARRASGVRAAWVAALLATGTGVFAFNEALILQSALDPFLTALTLWSLHRALERGAGGLLRFAGAGVALGLFCLNRPNALLFAATAVAGTALLRRSRAGLAQAGVLALGLALALAPVALRNRLVAGEWVLLTSHGGLNFYIGNNAQADGTYRSVEGITPSIEGQARDARRVAEAALGRSLASREVSDYFYREAWRWIEEEPAAALGLFASKLAYALNAVDLSLNYSYVYYSRDEATVLRWLIVGPALLVPLGLLGLAVGAKSRTCAPMDETQSHPLSSRWLLPAFLIVYALSLAAFFVSSRYRLPLLVGLCASSGVAVDWLAACWSRRARGPLLGAALALAALAGFACWDFGLDDGRSNERTEMILRLVDAGRDAEARALLAKTEPTHPEPALFAYRVGVAWQQRGRPQEAVPLFERALALEPQRPQLHLSLGQALLETDRPAEAVPHLRAARDASPDNPGLGFDLARALAVAGQPAEALTALRQVRLPSTAAAADHLSVGQLALQLGDAALAEPALRQAVARESQLAVAHERLGLALAAQGRTGEGRAELEEAHRLDPASASACLNLAVLEAREGQLDRARSLAREALRLQPDYPQALGLLASLARAR